MELVTDQLFLSIWLNPDERESRIRHFEKLLHLFPFSQREEIQSVVSIQAVDSTEPPVLERSINGQLDVSEILFIFSDYAGDDIAYRLESWWDLWQFDRHWKLAPASVTLSCFGPDFDNGTGARTADQEDLRIDFGVDSNFLPQVELPGSARLIESNIKSLLRLVHNVELSLSVAKRRLETESGENFANRLQQTLTPLGSLQ